MDKSHNSSFSLSYSPFLLEYSFSYLKLGSAYFSKSQLLESRMYTSVLEPTDGRTVWRKSAIHKGYNPYLNVF